MKAKGLNVWAWVELPAQEPYFLLSVQHVRDEAVNLERVLFSQLEHVLGLVRESDTQTQVTSVALLSPAHMNGTRDSQLSYVKEIWLNKDFPGIEIYVMKDGSEMMRLHAGTTESRDGFERVLSI